jgi:hypothetical protein
MNLRPFKPFRSLDILARVSHVENFLANLHAQMRAALKTEATQVVRETVSQVIDSSSGGGATTTDATTIHGEPIDDTQPVDGDILTYDTAENQWEPRQYIDGNFGIGTGANATARLQLAAGTATASTAPLKLTAGTNLTAEEDGAFEYDGARLHFTAQANRRSVALTSDTATSTATVANSAVRTTVATSEVDANSLEVGQVFILTVCGRYSTANGVDTFTLTAHFGAVDCVAFTSTAAAVTNAPVVVRFIGTVRSVGATGTIWATLEADVNNASKTQHDAATTTIDFGLALDPSLDVQWSNADAGNTFSADQVWLTVIN